MRVRSSSLVFACACNRILGLPEVAQRDASFYDANIDAPFACPALGIAPAYDHDAIVQVLDQPCEFYSTSETGDVVFGVCSGVMSEGAPNALLTPALGFDITNAAFDDPHLGPDGVTLAVMRYSITGPFTSDALLFHRGDTAWTLQATVSSGSVLEGITQPSREPNAHVIVNFDNVNLHEFVDTGVGWEDRVTFQLPDLYRGKIQLSPDGLHLWWSEQYDVYYADRATVDDPFEDVGKMPGTTYFRNAFMSNGCGWMFFPALDRVWRAPRT